MNPDIAVISGRVASDPQYMLNEQKTRCVFSLCLELERKRDPKFKGEAESEHIFTTVTVVASPDLTERCKTFLRREDEVMAVGEFGFHKGSLKMRALDLSLPIIEKKPVSIAPIEPPPIIC